MKDSEGYGIFFWSFGVVLQHYSSSIIFLYVPNAFKINEINMIVLYLI